jgi:hypothetical protein
MRNHHFAFVVLLLAACSRDTTGKIATVGEALPGLPLPPDSRVVSRAGTPNSLQITFQSAWPADSAASYYRMVLSQGGWTLQSDVVDATGAAVLYATREGPPIWIRITRTDGAPGSMIQINGAVISTAADSTKAGG